jgi:myo-inositol-1(or 4)-monophosphatase
LNGKRIEVSQISTLAGARLAVPESLLKRQGMAGEWPAAAVSASSTLYRLALVASAEADGTFALTSKWEWDVAAGALLIIEAGGTVTDTKGRQLRFNSEDAKVHGFIAAGPRLHQILLDRLKANC